MNLNSGGGSIGEGNPMRVSQEFTPNSTSPLADQLPNDIKEKQEIQNQEKQEQQIENNINNNNTTDTVEKQDPKETPVIEENMDYKEDSSENNGNDQDLGEKQDHRHHHHILHRHNDHHKEQQQQQQQQPKELNSPISMPLDVLNKPGNTEASSGFDFLLLQTLMIQQGNQLATNEDLRKHMEEKQAQAKEYLENFKLNDEFTQEMEDRLCNETYFDKDELHLLYRDFRRFSNSSLYMSKEQFIKNFTPFSSSSELTVSLMNAIDRNGDQKIAFPEFVGALSIMCRGNKPEKLRFTFEICDFNGDALISRNEAFQVISTISNIFVKFGFPKERFGDPEEAVDSVFSGGIADDGQYIHHKQELSLNEFIKRGELDPDLANCFGMFDYFYVKFLLPWDWMFRNREIKLKGELTKIKPKTIFNFNISHKRLLSLKDGFLIVYKKHNLLHKDEHKKPSKVLFLPGSTIRVVIGSDERRKKFLSKKYNNYYGFRITKGNYNRFFLMEDRDEALGWVNAIRANSRLGYRYQSFAKIRQNVHAEWYIHGYAYYNQLAIAIRAAKYQVFITGWWVWPYVYLQRDGDKKSFEKSRLDRVLTEKAKEGVKIYILMWNETNLGVQLGSGHAKRWFQSCHPNIHVIRHPKRYPLSWSHHQKCAVIDQEVAFVGGIDICGMRYEPLHFKLTDDDGKIFVGRDYGNLTTTVIRTGDPNKDQIDRREVPRMPWHDVHVRLVGAAARDAGFNFIQRWNHARDSKRSYKFLPLLLPTDFEKKAQKSSKIKNLFADVKRGISHLSYGTERENLVNRPGDNPKVRQLVRLGAVGYNDDEFDNRIAENTLKPNANEYGGSQYNSVDQDDLNDSQDHNENLNNNNDMSIPMTSMDRDIASSSNNNNNPVNKNITNTQNTTQIGTPKIKIENEDDAKKIYHYDKNESDNCTVQIVRSACEWSVGSYVEDSCYKAYISLIGNSQHFVYIQNLFFISSCGAKLPKNRIALAILQRVRRAILNKQKFRVIVLVSISPSGDIVVPSSRMIIGWTNRTIFHGGQSILELLGKEFPDVDLNEYISFNCLRQYEVNKDKIFTEQVYIHSKVMIIDDRVAIVGSCNINDRSMMGSRDSELACVVSDQSRLESTMNGKSFRVSKFAHTLRIGLWKLHLGLQDSQVSGIIDPISDGAFNDHWLKTAKSNTLIYKEVFGEIIPENQTKLSSTKQIRYIPKTQDAVDKLSNIRGVLIEYPREMFKDTNLMNDSVNVFTPEYYVDVSVFT
ncbi:hypothetical protein CYY_008336 [Polysphondylium violaceum]|uniref:phospholipase D n=1 Tax=Polysphondylium violaceum TaxID=133409 RepID=A0A8J4V420_9MYCE|nr:hypothetical protein CYY_008336 [Polysphondylium violaceum]